VQTAADLVSPAAYWRSAPIGGCLHKKQLNRFFPFAIISSKCGLNATTMGSFCGIIPLLTRNEMKFFCS
jgi:hypothetical protein